MDLIERDTQLGELAHWIARARGGEGGVVLVAGEAGVGKTQLVRAAIADAGVAALASEATLEAREPYAPVATVVRAHARRRRRSTFSPPEVARILPEGAGEASESSPPVLVEALSAWFAALGDREPALVFLDDLHWADGATLDLLLRLAADLQSSPVLVVGAYRSDEVTRGHPLRRLRVALRRAGRFGEIDVPPLGPEATVQLASRVLGVPIGRSLAAALYDRTQGVPFFVEELAAVLTPTHAVSGPDGLELTPGRELPLPETVRDTVGPRIDALGADGRTALEVAAVVGLRFELDLLEELGASADIHDAVANGLVLEVDAGTAMFRHALVREAVYADVPWARRRELHRRVAAALDARSAAPRLLAEHWLAAGESEHARVALLAAADASCSVHAYRDAAAALRRALEYWPEDDADGRFDAIDRLARCAERYGDVREAARLWESVLQDPGTADMLRVGSVKANLAPAYRLLGDRDRAAAARADAADAAGATSQPPRTAPSRQWSQPGSNRRPSRCQRDALPTELWPLGLGDCG